jgi:hypothetical protein
MKSLSKHYQPYTALENSSNRNSSSSLPQSSEGRPVSLISAKSTERVSVVRVNNAEKPPEVGNVDIEPSTEEEIEDISPIVRPSTVTVQRVCKTPKLEVGNDNDQIDSEVARLPQQRILSTISSTTIGITIIIDTNRGKIKVTNIGGIQPH